MRKRQKNDVRNLKEESSNNSLKPLTDIWRCMMNNFQRKASLLKNTQLYVPIVTLKRRDWLTRSANGVLLKTSVIGSIPKWFNFQFV